MADTDAQNFRTMQEEAVRRVREMQRRSRSYADEPTHTPPPSPIPENPPGGSPPKSESKALFNIGGIKIDEEKALIALMIYILYKNKADMKLLLALGYLLL